MIKYTTIIIFMMVLAIAPSFSFAQNIVWERTFTDSTWMESLQGIAISSDQFIYATGGNRQQNNTGQRRIFKFDTLGNQIWDRTIAIDSASASGLAKIEKVNGENNFYVAGGSVETSLYQYQFMTKIDSACDTIWTAKYTYPTFYNTLKNWIQLKDKSIVTVGEILTASGYDVMARRIDSLGNTQWEIIYNQAGEQFGFDITEMMDGSMILAGSSDGDNLLMRIGFDGRLIDSEIITVPNGSVRFQDIQLFPDNTIGLGILSRQGSSTNFGHYFCLDTGLNLTKSIQREKGIFNGPKVLANSTILFNEFMSNDDLQVSNFQQNAINMNWNLVYGNLNNSHKISLSWLSSEDDLFIAGYDDTGTDQDYWLAKIDGVGEEWIPDPCAFSPPIAGFDYALNSPILTLLDTSYSGLPYLDTIYTWQWTFGNGMVDTTESPVTLWDTASTPTLDVELIVSNWYGCSDTLRTTLVANPVGTGIIVQTLFEEKVWPNPARDVLNISLSERPNQNVFFEVFDVHGRKQLQTSFTGKEGNINISALASGIYFYILSSGNVVRRGKVVKE